MKKTNKKLSINAESIRALTSDQLTKAAGGAPQSHLGSGCLSCDCTYDNCDTATCAASACNTQCPSFCGITCVFC